MERLQREKRDVEGLLGRNRYLRRRRQQRDSLWTISVVASFCASFCCIFFTIDQYAVLTGVEFLLSVGAFKEREDQAGAADELQR